MLCMHDRSLLGPADVDDATLTGMVAALLGHDPADVEVLTSRAAEFPYDIPSITTVGRYWVTGTAATPVGQEPFRLFVKHVQAWRHSPHFADVPDDWRERAAASVPWRIESLVYGSDLGERLPDGLTMPRAVGIFDVEPESAVVWLEAVEHEPVEWTPARYERAAYLLGRLSGSPRVAERARVGEFDWHVDEYVHGRVQVSVLPHVMGDEAWQRPDVAAAFGDELRDRMRAAGSRLAELGAELAALPHLVAHGDSSPNNLLPGPRVDDFVLIDYGFFMPLPLGFDLGQLMAGEVQLGHGLWHQLPELDWACVAAYTRGLADEGVEIAEDVVRRAHALHLLIFAGLSSLPRSACGTLRVMPKRPVCLVRKASR